MNPHVQRGEFFFAQSRFIEAEAEIRAALADGAESAELQAMLGLCLHRSGLHAESREAVARALDLDPHSPYVHYARSYVEQPAPGVPAFRLGVETERCLAGARQAVQLAAYEPRYHLRLAQVYQLRGEWRKSLGSAEAALELDPRNVSAAVARAEALCRLNRRQLARETLLRALELNPEASAAHAGMGWALLRAGDHRRAAEFFDEALRLRPESVWAQDGALECAKHQYWLYRWLSFTKGWRGHLSAVQVLTFFAMAGLAGAAVCFLVMDVMPVIRARFGDNTASAAVMGIIVSGIGFVVFHDYFFLWLARKHRAARSDRALHQRQILRPRMVAMLAGVFVAAMVPVLKPAHPLLVAATIGSLPGLISGGITLTGIPAGNLRRWMLVYSAAVLVLGPVVAILFHKLFDDLGNASILVLVPPILPAATLSARCQEEDLRQRHKKVVESLQQPRKA
jgi:tetratricopeptide (TPR) repeat protein